MGGFGDIGLVMGFGVFFAREGRERRKVRGHVVWCGRVAGGARAWGEWRAAAFGEGPCCGRKKRSFLGGALARRSVVDEAHGCVGGHLLIMALGVCGEVVRRIWRKLEKMPPELTKNGNSLPFLPKSKMQ